MQQKFDAVILAGGKGTRLMPLTEKMPKPMLPVMGVPVIERLYRTLEQNGYEAAAVTVCHLADSITHTGGDTKLKLKFFKEDVPLGSAGAVRAIIDELCDTVTVLCGDAVVDIDLKKAKQQHMRHGGITLLLARTASPFEYGTVLLDGDKIKGFTEKPSLTDTLTDLISTGIYIIDKDILMRIPEKEKFDFALDLFPLLQKENIPLYGLETDGIWMDIGSIGDYYSCNMRLSEGVSVTDGSAEISNRAEIRRSVIMSGAKIGDSVVDGAIICRNVSVGDGCVIPSGCVIGEGTVLQSGVTLSKGLHLEGGMIIRKGSVLSKDWCFGEASGRIFDDDGVCTRLDCASAVRLGRALSVLGRPAKIGVMSLHDVDRISDSISLGAAEAGCEVIRFKPSFLPVARFAADEYGCDCLAYCISDDRIFLLGKGGIRLSSVKMKQVVHAVNAPLHVSETGSISDINPLDAYARYLQGQVGSLEGVLLPLTQKNAFCSLLSPIAMSLGAECAARQYGYTFSDDGEKASFRDEDGRTLSYWQLVILASMSRQKVSLPRETPVSVERALRSQGIAVHIYNDSESEARNSAMNASYVYDAALLALLAEKQLLTSGMTAAEAKSRLPEIFVVTRTVEGDSRDSISRIDELSRTFGDITRGVRINYRGGSVAVYPGAGGGFKIFAEAVSSEIANELCDLTERRLK